MAADTLEAAAELEREAEELAVTVQEALGEDFEVFFCRGELVHRVRPPGSWDWETWRVDILGYPPRRDPSR